MRLLIALTTTAVLLGGVPAALAQTPPPPPPPPTAPTAPPAPVGPTPTPTPIPTPSPTPTPTPTQPQIDLSMTRSEALSYARRMIGAQTNGAVKRLTRNCSAISNREYRCRLSWRIGMRSYSGAARFVHFERNGKVWWTYTFNGKRTEPRRKARKLTW